MSYFKGSRKATKEPLGSSSLEDWSSFLESSHGEETSPQCPESLLGRIVACSRTPRGLAVSCILWVLLVLVLVFASILLISWEIPARAGEATSTGASRSPNASDGWMGRRLSCSVLQLSDEWNSTLEEGRSLWKFGTNCVPVDDYTWMLPRDHELRI